MWFYSLDVSELQKSQCGAQPRFPSDFCRERNLAQLLPPVMSKLHANTVFDGVIHSCSLSQTSLGGGVGNWSRLEQGQVLRGSCRRHHLRHKFHPIAQTAFAFLNHLTGLFLQMFCDLISY